MVVIFLPNKVKAFTPYNSELSYKENADGETVSIKARHKEIERATIPSEINGKPVTVIADNRISRM